MRVLICCLVVLGICTAKADSTNANQVKLPDLPKAYAAYMIDPDSVSPDGQYGVMYLSAPPDDDATSREFVVALKPFRVVVELVKGDDAYFADRSNSDLAAIWAKNSSAVLVMNGNKWGPGEAYLVPVAKGKAGKIVELGAEVRKFCQPDLNKVKHERYNDIYDFVFVGDNNWAINDKGQVVIDVDCSTNPKGDPNTESWEGSFHGVWDIAEGKFVQHTFKRTFTGMNPE